MEAEAEAKQGWEEWQARVGSGEHQGAEPGRDAGSGDAGMAGRSRSAYGRQCPLCMRTR